MGIGISDMLNFRSVYHCIIYTLYVQVVLEENTPSKELPWNPPKDAENYRLKNNHHQEVIYHVGCQQKMLHVSLHMCM